MKNALFTLLCLMAVPTISFSSELVKDGKTTWKIVLPSEPTVVEKTAARELAEHLKLVTGAEFETIAEREVPADAKSLIFIGNTAKAPQKDYRFDEILIKMDSGNLILAGHEKRGCLYAVYSFLQDTVGVRWWTADATYTPKRPTLVVADDLEIAYAPQLISREMYHRDAKPTVFSARMKGNGDLTAEYGGAVRIIHFVHSFYKYLPPAKYYEAHPDWYSEIDGKRRHQNAQLCLTNEEMIAELIKNVLQKLRENPGAKIIDVSQNDCRGFCTCEKCKAIDEAEGSHAGTLLWMLNRVAEAVEKEFPDVLVESLAYQYTRKPPRTIKPRDNVIIRLCTIECSFLQPLDGPQNTDFAADIEGWSKLAKHLFIWDYTTNYRDYLAPHPNLRVLGPNVKYFVKHGAVGVFEEGEGDDFCELKNWLLMRMMWEPQLDADQLIDEFLCGYYGPAVAPLLKEYWDFLITRAEEKDFFLSCFCTNANEWLDLGTLNRATELMNRAVDVATKTYGPESDELRRLRKSKMGVDHVWLSRYQTLRRESREKNLPFLGPDDPIQAVRDFAALCKQFKTDAVNSSVRGDIEEYFVGIEASFRVRNNPPEFCKDVPDDHWLVFDARSFANIHNAATTVDDPAGWDGKSVRMGPKVRWNTQCRPNVDGKYRVWASLRCEGSLTEGRVGTWGVYNSQHKETAKHMPLEAKQFVGDDGALDKEFRWIDMGTVDFRGGSHVWFSHAQSPKLDAIFVDRVVLVEEE